MLNKFHQTCCRAVSNNLPPNLPPRDYTPRRNVGGDIYGRTRHSRLQHPHPSSGRRDEFRMDDISLQTSTSRVLYSGDGRYTRYPQPSPPCDQSRLKSAQNTPIYSTANYQSFIRSAQNTPIYSPQNRSDVYKTSTPVKNVSFVESDSREQILPQDPSGDSSNLYSSPSTLMTTLGDRTNSRNSGKPTPPYKTPPSYATAVRRSPSGASFEFSPSPIHHQQKKKIAEGGSNANCNIDDGRSTEKSCEKLDILEVISNHSNPESNYEEITNLDKAKAGVKDTHTEPKAYDINNETIYDRIIADLTKGVESDTEEIYSSARKYGKKSLVLSARQRASLVCPAGLADDSLLRETLTNAVEGLDITDEHNESVSCWLQEMRIMTEPECLTALQSKLEKVLSEACISLGHQMSGEAARVPIIISLLDKVQCSFRKLVVEMLAQEITNIVEILEEPGNEHVLRTAVNNVIALGGQCNEMCAIISESGGIRGLLTVILEKKYRFLRAQAVRALATICCIPQAINELEKQGGIECLTDILCDVMSNEQEKSEAAGVIAQITSPWIDYNQKIQGLTENAGDLVRSITDLADKTNSPEVFLLAAAALANITFMDKHAYYYLRESGTIKTLIRAARFTDKAHSLFAKDQVVTVLSNMAENTENKADLLENGGIILLLCYLQERPTVVYNKAELAACERVQQKSAIAIARLCSEQEAAISVSKLQGIQRLVRLCKDEKERNCSDSVLLACLAALRRATDKVGNDVLKELEAEDLFNVDLIENYKKYSTNETDVIKEVSDNREA
ncbi:Protein inscuteable [Nymphon striatum]|nr:Protein inscuteable [Nymphon striatum]